VPIAKFQVLQHRMVDMFMNSSSRYSITYMATIKLNEDAEERAQSRFGREGADRQGRRFVGQHAVQLHGGMGMTDEMRRRPLLQAHDDARRHIRQCRLSPPPLHRAEPEERGLT
jgi:alkylation response protein AidB-like acyl-CoA dehydrogenase